MDTSFKNWKNLREGWPEDFGDEPSPEEDFAGQRDYNGQREIQQMDFSQGMTLNAQEIEAIQDITAGDMHSRDDTQHAQFYGHLGPQFLAKLKALGI